MHDSPLISVIMPVYHSDNYLSEAIESILKQTFTNFELLMIVDDPTTITKQIIDKYAQNDQRVRVFYQNDRSGLTGSLNLGCKSARGKYLARMDADDICAPDRFESQYNYMEEHPEIGILGSWTDYIDINGKIIDTFRPSTSPEVLNWRQYFGNFVSHPTMMIRRDLMEELGFYHNIPYSEDYDLLLRAGSKAKIAIIPRVLLKYRMSGENIGSKYSSTQEDNFLIMLQSSIARLLGDTIDLETIRNLRYVVRGKSVDDTRQTEAVENLILALRKKYIQSNQLSFSEKREISRYAGELFLIIFLYTKPARFSSRLNALGRAILLYPFIVPGMIIRLIKKRYYINKMTD